MATATFGGRGPGGIVLLLGSGPDVMAARALPRATFSDIVAINNAWRVRDDWDWLIHPEDFPGDRHPADLAPHQRTVTYEAFVPEVNAMGGMVYAGGTMAFTAGYWALGALRPAVLAFLGCDMVYPAVGRTHFYGRGTPDPLRPDVTLRSLEAKSARLWLHAARAGCRCVNLSRARSRLVFPRAAQGDLAGLAARPPAAVSGAMAVPLAEEARLDYRAPSGRYWLEGGRFDAGRIDALDRAWLAAYRAARAGMDREDGLAVAG